MSNLLQSMLQAYKIVLFRFLGALLLILTVFGLSVGILYPLWFFAMHYSGPFTLTVTFLFTSMVLVALFVKIKEKAFQYSSNGIPSRTVAWRILLKTVKAAAALISVYLTLLFAVAGSVVPAVLFMLAFIFFLGLLILPKQDKP